MLPLLFAGGLVAGLGKLIYDAVTSDSDSSPSSPSVDEQAKSAQSQRKKELRSEASKRLLADTETAVTFLLEKHAVLLTGRAKTPAAQVTDAPARTLNPAASWPMPTGVSGSATGSSTDEDVLSMRNLRDLSEARPAKKGFDALKPLTEELTYTQEYLQERKTIAKMRKQRDALRTLAETL